MKQIAILILWMAMASPVYAAICSQSEVQSAVTAASNGGTVTLTAACTSTWATPVAIPNTKGITLDLNGATINGLITVAVNATTGSRVTNGTLSASASSCCDPAALSISGTSLTGARWRADHLTFTGTGHVLIDMNYAPGLFDHNALTNGLAANEQIHINGWGAASTTGWTTDMPSTGNTRAQGTDEAIIFEDNTFSASSAANANNSWIQGYYGARVVFRYNTFTYFRVDMHGTAGNIGSRWWEFYNNDFKQNSGGNAGGFAQNLRAGSGITFGNTKSGTEANNPVIGMCEEDGGPYPTGYPANYQIGRGTGPDGSESQDQAYAWSNAQSVLVNQCEAPQATGMVGFNRDVYTDVDSASCASGGACTSGVGTGTSLPTTCTVGVAYWKTDAGGNWDTTHGGANDGALYKCTSTNTFTLYYTPYTYPDPLISGSCTADHLAFTAQPSNANVGAVLGTVTVQSQDSGNSPCDNGGTITIANKGGTCTGMTLGGTASGTMSSAAFTTTNLTENAAGSCTLSATSSGLTGADSSAFTISAVVTASSGRMRLRR